MSALILIQMQTGNLIRPVTFRIALYKHHQVSERAGGGADFLHTNQERVMAFTEVKYNRIMLNVVNRMSRRICVPERAEEDTYVKNYIMRR